MKYTVIWSEFSESQLDEIFDYYKEKSKSLDVALKIITKIIVAPDILIENPRLGQIEPLLERRTDEYRYLLESNYKIIYSVNDDKKTINIADVFDVRQNPVKIKRKK